MARITIEDCLGKVDNRFQLVLLASKRARHLVMSGSDPFVEWGTDKPTVVALREISEGYITPSYLMQAEEEENQEDPFLS